MRGIMPIAMTAPLDQVKLWSGPSWCSNTAAARSSNSVLCDQARTTMSSVREWGNWPAVARKIIELHEFSPATKWMKAGADDFVPLTVPLRDTAKSPSLEVNDLIGRDGEIRTRDPLHPMQVRYQAAPRPDTDSMLHGRTFYDNFGV